MPTNAPRVPKAAQRDAARQKALEMKAQQEKRAKRSRIIAITGLVAALAVLAVVVVMILGQARPTAADLDPETPLAGITAPTTAIDNGGIPVGAEGAAGTTSPDAKVTVSVYFDYMCPVCGDFEAANAAPLDELVKAGDITLEYHPISILDRLSQGTQFSTRAAQAAAFIADADPANFAAFHEAMYAAQPEENTAGLSDEEITAIAVEAGVPQATADQIFADGGKFTSWVTAATAQGTLDGVTGTPTVMINGEKVAADVDLLTAGPLEEAIRAAIG